MQAALMRGAGLSATIVLALAPPARADVRLPAVFGDHMVLQRDAQVPVWGWAGPGERVVVSASWGGAPAAATADRTGRWRIALATPGAGGPHTLQVSGGTTITLSDVLVGEVWLGSGQSNMEMSVSDAAQGGGAAPLSDQPAIRLFNVPNTLSLHERGDAAGGRWEVCGADRAGAWSAVAHAFALELHAALGGVPIGILTADWGGTVVEAWMSDAMLDTIPRLDAERRYLADMRDPGRRLDAARARRERWWSGLDQGADLPPSWTLTPIGVAAWPTMDLPCTFGGELASFDGVVYLRRTVDAPNSAAGRAATLELGPIDDCDDAWVNGVHVGATHDPGRWGEPRAYAVPPGVLRAGPNTVALRVLDTGGLGGVNGAPADLGLRLEGGDRIELAGPWRYTLGSEARRLPPLPEGPEIHQNMPGVLYKGMVAPLVPYAIAGVIWYQGESNRSRAAEYADHFPRLIADWRARWGRSDLPFYYVQIAPFAYGNDRGETAALREAQLHSLRVPGTGMVVTMDIGDPRDIHPANKREVGRRLSLWALSHTYGREGVTCSGPLLRSMHVEGAAIRLRFDHADGLVLRPAPRSHFLIAGADQRFAIASARVEGETLVVRSEGVREPVAVRYAWEAAAEPNLFNGTGLPASPFRTDDWPIDLGPADNDADMAALRGTEAGFAPLFNGRDLSGWVNVNGAPSTWTVEQGMIACSGLPTGVLRTERAYENFILEVEWRHLRPEGNAGIFVWSDPLTARGQPFTRSVEVQVMDGLEGDWYTSDGDIFPIHGASMVPENGRGGDRAFPTERRVNRSPLWNHYRITCDRGAVSLAVNGKVVTRGRDCRPRRGYICLESEGSPVHFRNLRIRELPPSSPPLDAADVAAAAEPFEPLYNGVDLSGWKAGPEHQGHWRPSDWRLAFDGQGPDLWTERSFGDFVLVADWRWTAKAVDTPRPIILATGETALDSEGNPQMKLVSDAGDSGIYLRGSSKSQVNIWCWPIGSGEVYGYCTDPGVSGAVRAAVTPRVAADAPIGQWNRFVITMKGDRLTVVLNGQTVIESAHLPGVAAAGPIALQSHGNPIEFANLHIRPLP
jgi:sialate O-acetylesterase